jgi:hypothetical protein
MIEASPTIDAAMSALCSLVRNSAVCEEEHPQERETRGQRRAYLVSAMRALDLKLFRDLARLWAQALAIALVIGGGVATLVLAVGSIRSLVETRDAYYERNQFADVFALLKRAPKGLIDRIAEIPGVATAEARIVKLALLDVRRKWIHRCSSGDSCASSAL